MTLFIHVFNLMVWSFGYMKYGSKTNQETQLHCATFIFEMLVNYFNILTMAQSY